MSGAAAANGDVLARLPALSAILAEQPESAAAAAARELLQVILGLHAQGLGRILDLIAGSAGGAALLERLAEDEESRALLLLHDLHPQDLAARVTAAVARLRPQLAVYGIRIEEFAASDGKLKLALHGTPAPDVAPPPPEALRGEIEAEVYALAPDLEAILIDGLPVPTAYVPLSQLTRTAKAAAGSG